jgi:hypothetical protein
VHDHRAGQARANYFTSELIWLTAEIRLVIVVAKTAWLVATSWVVHCEVSTDQRRILSVRTASAWAEFWLSAVATVVAILLPSLSNRAGTEGAARRETVV